MHHNLCSIKKEVYRFNHLRARLNRYRKTRFTRVSMDVRRPSVPVMQKKFKKRCPDSGLDQKSGYLWQIMIYGSKTKNCIFSLFVCDTLCVLCSSVIVNFLFRPRASSVKQSIPFITQCPVITTMYSSDITIPKYFSQRFYECSISRKFILQLMSGMMSVFYVFRNVRI